MSKLMSRLSEGDSMARGSFRAPDPDDHDDDDDGDSAGEC